MADTAAAKRSSNNRVATPKTSASGSPAIQPLTDPLETLGKAIGARIKLTTSNSVTHEGTIFTACPILNVVAINTRKLANSNSQPSSADAGDYHIIPVSRIQNFQILSLPAASPEAKGEKRSNAFAQAQPSIGPIDTKLLQQRERNRIRALHDEERHRGPQGVTREAQAIYDAFRRINMPIRWHNVEMIVHEAVIISPPYHVEDCKGPREKQDVLNRVKKVLEGERRKIQEREKKTANATTGTSDDPPSTAAGPARKGG